MGIVSFVSALCDAAAVGDEDLRHVLQLRRIKPVEAHDVPRERRQLVLIVHFLEQIVPSILIRNIFHIC